MKISNGYLASVHYTAEAIKRYFVCLTKCLEDSRCWESEYQADKEIRQNRRFLVELTAVGIVVDETGLINAFPPLGPVE